MRDGQAGYEILRLHAEHPVGRHRQYQIDRLALRLVEDDFVIAQRQPIKPDDALARGLVELLAVPQRVADRSRLGIETDIPGEINTDGLFYRHDYHCHREEMRNPPLDHFAERTEP